MMISPDRVPARLKTLLLALLSGLGFGLLLAAATGAFSAMLAGAPATDHANAGVGPGADRQPSSMIFFAGRDADSLESRGVRVAHESLL